MTNSKAAALVFANTKDSLLGELTKIRSMASVPFGARYRIIDFALSNLVNAGIINIGIITKSNYKSLMDHMGSGIFWDLDRKQGGLHLLPPFSSNYNKRYDGIIEALYGGRDFIDRCGAEDIVICAGDLIANVDLESALAFHKEKGADVTFICAEGESPDKHSETPIIECGGDGKIDKFTYSSASRSNVLFGTGLTIIKSELLKTLVVYGYENNIRNLNSDILARKLNSLKEYAFIHKGYVGVTDSIKKYYDLSMALLDPENRKDLFNPDRPVMTKIRDDMPTRYGINAEVSNCIIADGCVIEGTVKNSILFRGVKVGKNTVIENSIIMQEGKIKDNASLNYLIADKNVRIGSDVVMKGTSLKPIIIEKNVKI